MKNDYKNDDKAKIAELEAEVKRFEFMLDSAKNVAINRGRVVDRLQSHDKEAMELLEAAFQSLKSVNNCNTCSKVRTPECGACNGYVWIYADRYEALKAQSTAPTKNTDGEE